jgi:hypothetical protein
VLLTAEPLRAYGEKPDGALASVFAYTATEGQQEEFAEFARLIGGATVI